MNNILALTKSNLFFLLAGVCLFFAIICFIIYLIERNKTLTIKSNKKVQEWTIESAKKYLQENGKNFNASANGNMKNPINNINIDEKKENNDEKNENLVQNLNNGNENINKQIDLSKKIISSNPQKKPIKKPDFNINKLKK